MKKAALVLILCLWLTLPVKAQEVGDSTETILDNVATQQKPQEVVLDEESCTFLGFPIDCPAPKVDYTHADLLPQQKKIKENLTFWQKLGNFFRGLFTKSTDPQTGYGYSYLPKEANSVKEIKNQQEDGLSLEAATDLMHETVEKSFLPFGLNNKSTDTPVSVQDEEAPYEEAPYNEAETDVDASSDSVEYAKFLVATAGKNCGWTTTNIRTKTLSCNNCQVPPEKKPVPIKCLNGKVEPDVYLDLERSANGCTWLQCVGFVVGVEQGVGRELVPRNAKDYCLKSTPLNYVSVSKNNIQPGDIVANTVPPWGHIMLILEVYKGSQAYKIAEANWAVRGSMGQPRIIYGSDIDCVLRPQKK